MLASQVHLLGLTKTSLSSHSSHDSAPVEQCCGSQQDRARLAQKTLQGTASRALCHCWAWHAPRAATLSMLCPS